jgi:dipeptidase E
MTIYLSGGDNVGLKEFLDNLIGENLLYIPLALDPNGQYYNSCENWLKGELANNSKRKFNIDTIKGNTDNIKSRYDGIFIGGGNTHRLAYELKRLKLTPILYSWLKSIECSCFAVSAGAIFLGKSIHTSLDKNPGLPEANGLNLIRELSLICHYNDTYEAHTHEFIKKYNLPVLALENNCTIKIEKEFFSILGSGEATVFYPENIPLKFNSTFAQIPLSSDRLYDNIKNFTIEKKIFK